MMRSRRGLTKTRSRGLCPSMMQQLTRSSASLTQLCSCSVLRALTSTRYISTLQRRLRTRSCSAMLISHRQRTSVLQSTLVLTLETSQCYSSLSPMNRELRSTRDQKTSRQRTSNNSLLTGRRRNSPQFSSPLRFLTNRMRMVFAFLLGRTSTISCLMRPRMS
jgi:hypothetical protein